MTEGTSWDTFLEMQDGRCLRNIHIEQASSFNSSIALSSHLKFLAFLDPTRVPLNLISGPNCHVIITNDKTEDFFTDVLIEEKPFGQPNGLDDTHLTPWHETNEVQSRIGILAEIVKKPDAARIRRPRVTEILFYAQRLRLKQKSRLSTPPPSSPRTSKVAQQDTAGQLDEQNDAEGLTLQALPLSSDLIDKQEPPADLASLSSGEARVLPLLDDLARPRSPQSKKRLDLSELFNEATDRHKKAKNHGGRSISLAVARGGPSPLTFGFDGRRIKAEEDNAASFPKPESPAPDASDKQSKSLAKIADRPIELNRQNGSMRHSRSFSVSQALLDESVVSRNKHTVSRIVMAGMRMHGLQQSKTPRAQKNLDDSQFGNPDEPDLDFKGIYHQTYKGTVFAFRQTIDTSMLKADAVRDVVDRLLAIYCNEPP